MAFRFREQIRGRLAREANLLFSVVKSRRAMFTIFLAVVGIGIWTGYEQCHYPEVYDLVQFRTHNGVNEITGIGESTGESSWRTSSSRMCAWITGARPPTRPLSGCTAD